MSNRFIEKLSLLTPLDTAACAALAKATAIGRKVRAKHDLAREGDRPSGVIVILDGWASRYKILPLGNRQILALLMPGDFCDLRMGHLAELDHSIQTVTPATIATIDRGEMDQIADRHPSIAKAFYAAQTLDEGTLRSWLTSMGRRASLERVAHLLFELHIRANVVGLSGDGVFMLPISQVMLADALGMTAVHVNRVLQKLRLNGAVGLSRGNLTLTDPERLAQVAGFDANYLQRRMLRAA